MGHIIIILFKTKSKFNMLRTLFTTSCLFVVVTSALLPHPYRLQYPIKHDYTYERNCFFSPAQCLLGNFPRSSSLQPVLRVFEEKSLRSIYSKLLITNSKPAFFGSKK
ncbi:Neuropeptide-Like Protein [Caenorhabditis elegans]|uniref:Neuropeptide-Like Protein n=1 Tax=Caenorhabditis elegans TaxID=6239 RepID=B1Q235_CAEEL|nr:Neuropeptide-Like Protein [Caenorhabditis elegans]CCD67574.1 Neuropeptide-Like Protein [Caenorhabditis elegans]|eukprot:NP_001123158.1 Uncharacterized protein CELE_K02A6.4 [Caenorhabditis elegans]